MGTWGAWVALAEGSEEASWQRVWRPHAKMCTCRETQDADRSLTRRRHKALGEALALPRGGERSFAWPWRGCPSIHPPAL